MSEGFKTICAILVCLLVILCIAWIIQGSNFFMYKVFAPAYQQTQREVFEQSQSYNEGTKRELQNYYMEYPKASPEHKAAIRTVVLERVSGYDISKLPPDIRSWIAELKEPVKTK